MVLRWGMLLGMLLGSLMGYSQEQVKKKTSRPDIPGSLLVELGINIKSGTTPANFQKGLWGSRTFNVYYQYPLRLFKSKISFNPGLGLSLERWKLTNYYTLAPKPLADGTYPLVLGNDIYPGTMKRSQIINNYVEAPLEFRFDTNPEDIARSFNIAIGGRVGYLFDSLTKMDFRDNAENKTVKDKQFHGMNPWRYGVFARMGLAGFSVFGYYNVSTMFEKNMGPEMTPMSSGTIGISINGF